MEAEYRGRVVIEFEPSVARNDFNGFAIGFDPVDGRTWLNNKPIRGTFTEQELCDAYGDNWRKLVQGHGTWQRVA